VLKLMSTLANTNGARTRFYANFDIVRTKSNGGDNKLPACIFVSDRTETSFIAAGRLNRGFFGCLTAPADDAQNMFPRL